ncbi:DUF5672 family protein [Pseudomonadota bacterium]
MNHRKNNSVIVLIFAHKEEPDNDELISLRQCVRVLGHHPMRLVLPSGISAETYLREAPNVVVDPIPANWLASLRDYNRLKIHPFLYRRYREFEFILTYELDAFVFRDELQLWCDRGWDYIGAPWFDGFQNASADSPMIGAGNSGFSLRRIPSMLRVTRSLRWTQRPHQLVQDWKDRPATFRSTGRLLKDLCVRNNTFWLFNDYSGPEDMFWGLIVPERFPWFRIAPPEEAMRFSFEVNPRRLYQECDNRLPFGCHKWKTYDPAFWRSFIEPDDEMRDV